MELLNLERISLTVVSLGSDEGIPFPLEREPHRLSSLHTNGRYQGQGLFHS